VDKSDILANIGAVIAGLFAGWIAYYSKKPPVAPQTSDAVVAGVGLELGNRLQIDQLIGEVKRCADSLAILADRKQATTEAKLDRILEELDEAEEREREARARPTRPRQPRQRKPKE